MESKSILVKTVFSFLGFFCYLASITSIEQYFLFPLVVILILYSQNGNEVIIEGSLRLASGTVWTARAVAITWVPRDEEDLREYLKRRPNEGFKSWRWRWYKGDNP